MKRRYSRISWVMGLSALVVGACAAPKGSDKKRALNDQVEGLWLYTGLTTSEGTDLPLTGIFLFKDDTFLQQAVFNDEPFEGAGSMAHAGPYSPEPATGSVHLIAEQTISLAPTERPVVTFRRATEHDVTVSRTGNALTLVFSMGTGTVQEFTKIGPGTGEIYALADGALAFVDGYFVLVDGDEERVTTGYGRYQKQGDNLTLNVVRWAEADGTKATNLKDVTLSATFDGRVLTLEDGRTFTSIAATSVRAE